MNKRSDYLVIIPAYNEEQTIEEIVCRAKTYADVCVIDDNSNDATPQILRKCEDIHVVTHAANTHIPGGLLDGMRYAVEQGYLYAIAMDAGLSHNPDEIPRFMEQPYSDLVIGVRTVKTNIPLYRRALSSAGNMIYNCALNLPSSLTSFEYYRDISSGYRRYSNKAMRLLLSKQIESRSFDVMFESFIYIYRNGLEISEVPITYAFSNSSLNPNAVLDCLKMCIKAICNPRKYGP
jgi:dolichol-phosphate mannosyltransferase